MLLNADNSMRKEHTLPFIMLTNCIILVFTFWLTGAAW